VTKLLSQCVYDPTPCIIVFYDMTPGATRHWRGASGEVGK
jgi:hypothetical protein